MDFLVLGLLNLVLDLLTRSRLEPRLPPFSNGGGVHPSRTSSLARLLELPPSETIATGSAQNTEKEPPPEAAKPSVLMTTAAEPAGSSEDGKLPVVTDLALKEARSTAYYARYYGDQALLPRATDLVRYHGLTYTLLSLHCSEWVVGQILVEDFAFFIAIVPVWRQTIYGEVRWRGDCRKSPCLAAHVGTPITELLPTRGKYRGALSISRPASRWRVGQHVRVASGGISIAMPIAGHLGGCALIVHTVKQAKSREPIVEAYFVGHHVEDGRPDLDSVGYLPMRVVLSFHALISLAANSFVWALAPSPLDGSPCIMRVLPRGLSLTATEPPDPMSVVIPSTCEGLDLVGDDGVRHDILHARLCNRPRPHKRRRPRKRSSNRLCSPVYRVPV